MLRRPALVVVLLAACTVTPDPLGFDDPTMGAGSAASADADSDSGAPNPPPRSPADGASLLPSLTCGSSSARKMKLWLCSATIRCSMYSRRLKM